MHGYAEISKRADQLVLPGECVGDLVAEQIPVPPLGTLEDQLFGATNPETLYGHEHNRLGHRYSGLSGLVDAHELIQAILELRLSLPPEFPLDQLRRDRCWWHVTWSRIPKRHFGRESLDDHVDECLDRNAFGGHGVQGTSVEVG